MIQNTDHVTYAQKLEKSESVISWHDTAQEIDRKVRALNPWPGVVADISGQGYKIWQTQVVSIDTKAKTGDIVKADKKYTNYSMP